MFGPRTRLSFEGSPLEVIRRYGPAFIGIFAGLAVVILIYEYAHDGAKDMLTSTESSVTDIIDESKTETTTIIDSFYT